MKRSGTERKNITLIFRLLGIYVLLGMWGVILVVRLAQLQLFKSPEYRLKAEQQQVGFVELSPQRGDILDRHLDELAISVRIDSVFAHPREVVEPLQAARALAGVLDQDEHELYQRMVGDRPFVYLARKIPPRQADQVRELNLEGVYFQEETKRFYPGRDLAAHVLGFTGLDNEGLAGLEYLYNDSIKGKKSRVRLRFDAKRRRYESDARSDHSDGNTMVLNIDRAIQYISEQVLKETVLQTEAVNGSVIVMDPQTGEVLAMASYPTFNPNSFSDFDPEGRRNRAILDIMEPGSTFKMVTFSAVLNERLGDPSEIIDCDVNSLRIAGRTYREAVRPYSLLTFNQVLAKSSNIGTIKLGLRLGEETLYQYIRNFGFGEKTGIDLPGEQAGLLRPPSQWSKVSIGALSIGQEIGVTPLQSLRALSVIANGGYLVAPQVVRRILTPAGDVLYQPETSRELILVPATVAQMKEAFSLVTTEGTGKQARLIGYSSGGKTGTAQKFIEGKYSDTRFVASYLGFAPLQESVLAAVIVINEPRGPYHGGQVAAPAFKQIMERSLIHLRVPRDESPELEPLLALAPGRELPDFSSVSLKEEQIPVEQLEETVLQLIEESPSVQESQRAITVEIGTFKLPDVSGLSLRQVASRFSHLGLRLKVFGRGVAVAQRPPAGSTVSPNVVCEVFFSSTGEHASSRFDLQSAARVSTNN
ncbi:MAG: penicillin-binding protein [Acidobacteriota bacterium]